MCRPSVAGWASPVGKERAVTRKAHGDGLESSDWQDLPGVQWLAKEDLPEEKSWECLGNTFHPMGEDHRKDTWERWEGKFWQSLRGRVCKNNENSVNNENNVFAGGIDDVSHWLHLIDFSPLRIFNFQKWVDLKEEENNVLFAAGIDRKPPEQCSHFSVTVSLSPLQLLHFDIPNS